MNDEPFEPMSDAGVFTAKSIGELDQIVRNLAQQRYRIVSVIDTHNDCYHVVAQNDDPLK